MKFLRLHPVPAAAQTVLATKREAWTVTVRGRGACGIAAAIVLLSAPVGSRALAQVADTRPVLVIDIPVTLATANVVFNIGRSAFEGDEPTGLSFLRVMSSKFKEAGTRSRIVAVFHGEPGYILLGDQAYDRVRHWTGGNPYRAQIAALQAAGVEFEECGTTMAANGWINREMLPGVKINGGANFRIVELVQQGFVQLQP